jgi:SOS response regulatory protein OraA/RecX
MEEFLHSPAAAAALGSVGIFICIAVIAVGCTMAVQRRKAHQVEIEAALKRDMLERGISADEIAKVLNASATTSEAALKRDMLDRGMSADEIVKVLNTTKASQESPSRDNCVRDAAGFQA